MVGEQQATEDSGYTGEGVKYGLQKVKADIVVTATAVENEHQTVTTNLTNCAIDNTSDYALLVGYEDQKNVQGTVTVELPFVPVPELDGSRPVRILGKICIDGDKVYLQGKSVYQNMKD